MSKINRNKWIWMPHPAHFICAKDCKFFLATKVGKYIVSTVGEYLPDSRIRQIYANSRGIKIDGMGDSWDADYLKKVGYEDLHFGGVLYETMVFRAKKSPKDTRSITCCPWRIIVSECMDEKWYKTANEAYKGHYKLCDKFSKK